jgi:uncharacterized integral membrane protein
VAGGARARCWAEVEDLTSSGETPELPLDHNSAAEDPLEGRSSTGPVVGVQLPPNAEHVTPTRISASWTAVVAAVVVLILLVIFVAENTQRSTVNFVGFHGHAPTAVVLLIAAIAGAVIVIIVGVARILQLRKAAKHSEN